MNTPEFGEILKGITYAERPGAYAFLTNSAQLLAAVRTPMGLFLPGGGVEPHEDLLTGLRRELHEEIGFTLRSAKLLTKAVQYHWSAFYQQHFKKIGHFYQVEAQAPQVAKTQADHELLWIGRAQLRATLTQEFQRWAVDQLP